jgi:hypothetical protein
MLVSLSISAALPALQPKALATMLGRSPCPVATYRAIAAGVASVDLRSDDAEPVRRRFNAYYGVRRNGAWRAHFYDQFEAAKHGSLTGADLFADVVRSIKAQTGRVEASFVSKLVATLNPEQPIIDSVVRRWLAPLTKAPPFKGGADGVIAYYAWLTDLMAGLVLSPEALAWAEAFDAAFPVLPGESAIPVMKRLDFLIWAGADR